MYILNYYYYRYISVSPLFLVTALYLRLDEAPELTCLNGPSCPVPLTFSHFKYHADALRIEGVNIDPYAVVKQSLVEDKQSVLIALFLCKTILNTPKSGGGASCVLLHSTGAHSEQRRVVLIPSEFIFSEHCVQPGKVI